MNPDSEDKSEQEQSAANAAIPAQAPKNSPYKLLGIRILGAIILVFAISACVVIFKKESVFWGLINTTKTIGEHTPSNPLIPGLTRLSYLLGETYLPDRKYILRSLATGRDATDDVGTKEALAAEYDSWFGLSPSRTFDKHYVDAVTLAKDPSKLRQAIKEANEASKCATDAQKTSSAARALALALCADLYRKAGRTEEPLYLDRRAVIAANDLWFDDDIGSVPVRLSAAKVYLSIDHIDDAMAQLAIINRAYKKAFDAPEIHGSSKDECFDILQVDAEVKARAHQIAQKEIAQKESNTESNSERKTEDKTATRHATETDAKKLALQIAEAETSANRAIDLAENKVRSPEMAARAYIAKGLVLLEQKRWKESESALRKAEKLKEETKTWTPDDVRLYLYLADGQAKSGDLQASAKSLEDAEKYCRSKRTHARIAEYKKLCLSKHDKA